MPKDVHQHLAIYAKKGWRTWREKYEEARVGAISPREREPDVLRRPGQLGLYGSYGPIPMMPRIYPFVHYVQRSFSLRPILLQRPNGMGFYGSQGAPVTVSGGQRLFDKAGGVCEEHNESWRAADDLDPSKPELREWKASDTCYFEDKHWFKHDSHVESAQFGEDHGQVLVLNASQPLGISACGKVIRVGCSDPREVLKTFDEAPTDHANSPSSWLFRPPGLQNSGYEEQQMLMVIKNLHFRVFDSNSHSQCYLRRLLRVLLQPLFPNCADDIAFGVGLDVCFQPKNGRAELNLRDALRFWVMSKTSIEIQKLETLLLGDFDYHKFRKSINKHVVELAAQSAVNDNSWLHANFVQPVRHAVKGMFSHNIRELDYDFPEQELQRLTAIRSIVSECQPNFASRLANAFFLRFEPEYLDRLIHCPFSSSAKVEIALEELHKCCPNEAEILEFHMARLAQSQSNKVVASGGLREESISLPEANGDAAHLRTMASALKQHQLPMQTPPCKQDSKEIISEAAKNPFCRGTAVAGALGPLPQWLQDLPCTTAINEDHPIQATCAVPTKVYLLSVGPRSIEAVAEQPKIWKSEGRENWAFVKGKHMWREIRQQFFMDPHGTSKEKIEIGHSPEQDEEKMFLEAFKLPGASKNLKQLDESSWRNRLHKLPTSTFDIFSTILQPGAHALDTTDAIYFFDTVHHVQQQSLQAGDAPLCPSFQRTQACGEGDRCRYSHRAPLVYTPDVFSYIGYMQQQCRKQLCAQLRLPITNAAALSHSRGRVYRMHTTSTWFPARKRVLSSALITEVVLRLLRPMHLSAVGNFKKVHEPAAHALTMRLYKGLMVQASEIDNDTYAFVEHGGYVYRTLFGRKHTHQLHYLDCGAVWIQGRLDHFGLQVLARELPSGYEISPADESSIEVCSMYEWRSLTLLLGDGHSYSTRLNYDAMRKLQRKSVKKAKFLAKAAAAKAESASSAAAAGSDSDKNSRGKEVAPAVPNVQHKPPVQPLSARVATSAKLVGVKGRIVTVEGGDVLIRRRCWSLM